MQDFVLALVAAVVALMLGLLVWWHAGAYCWRCPKCGHVFGITPLVDFISPHWPPDKKNLRCPSCNRRSWCREIPKKGMQ